MPEFRFSITKTETEWDIIGSLITSRFKCSPSHRGIGYSRLLSLEINKQFKDGECKPPSKKIRRRKKHFSIKISEEIKARIICEAKNAGINPGELISIKILEPILLEDKSNHLDL